MAQKITHFTVGSVWQPQATFLVNSTATDPTTITVLLQNAAGVESTVASSSSVAALTSASTPVAKMSTGVFKLNPGTTFDASGYWFVKFIGQGTATGTKQEEAIVDPDEFTSNAGISSRALVSLPEVKDWLNQQNLTVAEDLELVRVINDVSDRIHYEAGREFKPEGTNPQTRTFEISEYTRCVYIDDLTSLTTSSAAVTVVGTDWTTVISTVSASNIRTYPLNREPWQPITKLELSPLSAPSFLAPGMSVQVSGNWGFPAVPGSIRQAAMDSIAWMMDRDVEHYREDIAAGGGGGGETTVVVGGTSLMSLPASALAVVWDFRDPLIGY